MPHDTFFPEHTPRYNDQQWAIYARYIEFVDRRWHNVARDRVKLSIVRTVGFHEMLQESGITVASLAASLDIPEETVRRKCSELVEEGCLRRDETFYFTDDRLKSPRIANAVEKNIDRLLRSAEMIRQLDAKNGVSSPSDCND